jgi:CRISPR/Cas system CSM-associated protein Csm2 small subunit
MTERTDPASKPDPAAKLDLEPRVAAELVRFAEGDFHALSSACSRDAQFNDARLVLRRKLASLAKVFAARVKAEHELALDTRTSLHNPHAFNHMQVKRMWAYACREKKEKSRLKQTIGADLAKDLDAAYRNAFLCVALESDAIEVSLRIHADAWYDGQNLVHRVKKEGVDAWKKVLNELDGFRLKLADWRGEWVCGKLEREKLEEFLKYYKPGEHALLVECRFAAPPGARGEALAPEMPARIVDELARLVPLYRFAVWSKESDFLFAR